MKGMTFVDQASIDSGRTQLAWLLTGLLEPNYQVCQCNKQRAQLQPFSKLTSATAVAANVSYLKDLDFFGGPHSGGMENGKDIQCAGGQARCDTSAQEKGKRKRKRKRKGISQPSRRGGHNG